jgi:hypothetical protein
MPFPFLADRFGVLGSKMVGRNQHPDEDFLNPFQLSEAQLTPL